MVLLTRSSFWFLTFRFRVEDIFKAQPHLYPETFWKTYTLWLTNHGQKGKLPRCTVGLQDSDLTHFRQGSHPLCFGGWKLWSPFFAGWLLAFSNNFKACWRSWQVCWRFGPFGPFKPRLRTHSWEGLKIEKHLKSTKNKKLPVWNWWL